MDGCGCFLCFCFMKQDMERIPDRPRLMNPLVNGRLELVHQPLLVLNAANWSWRTRIPEGYWNLWVLLEGAVRFELGGESLVVRQPSYFFLAPGEVVRADSVSEVGPLNFALHIAKESLARGVGEVGMGRRGWLVRNPEWFGVTARACVEAANRPEAANQGLAAGLAQGLFLHFWRDATVGEVPTIVAQMHRLAAAMQLDPAHGWEVEKLARECGVSRSRFHRCFQEATGMSPRRMITHCRMERAKRLLAESEMNVTEVADAVGYRDVYFFSRHFKQQTGDSPLRYRRQRATYPGGG